MELPEEMLFCGSCGAPMRADCRFCPRCGAEQKFPEPKPVPEPEVPHCPHCGAPVKTDSLFCGSCGGDLRESPEQPPELPRCPQCGEPVAADASFCGICGADLSAAPEPEQPPRQEEPQTPVCPHCGNPVKPDASFCGICGADLSADPEPEQPPEPQGRFCTHCGAPIPEGNRFCGSCGADQTPSQTRQGFAGTKASFTKYANKLTGESGEVELKLKDLVSNVLVKHTKEEREKIFICGTADTTPAEGDISSEWPKPWLYSRVLAMFGITYLLLLIVAEAFQNTNALPGVIFVGALAVPFSVMVFFFEVNAPRNVSIFEVVKIFFIGGALSLIATVTLTELEFTSDQPYLMAIIISLTEEIGKLVVVAWFCRKGTIRHILTGLLIGSAVGAGFAVFESAGYAYQYLVVWGEETMKEVIYTRAALAAGGHVIWAAISGAALVLVKQDAPLASNHIFNLRFLRLFAVPLVLHALWDMPIMRDSVIGNNLFLGLLTVAAWVVALVLISAGLKQISRLSGKKE